MQTYASAWLRSELDNRRLLTSEPLEESLKWESRFDDAPALVRRFLRASIDADIVIRAEHQLRLLDPPHLPVAKMLLLRLVQMDTDVGRLQFAVNRADAAFGVDIDEAAIETVAAPVGRALHHADIDRQAMPAGDGLERFKIAALDHHALIEILGEYRLLTIASSERRWSPN